MIIEKIKPNEIIKDGKTTLLWNQINEYGIAENARNPDGFRWEDMSVERAVYMANQGTVLGAYEGEQLVGFNFCELINDYYGKGTQSVLKGVKNFIREPQREKGIGHELTKAQLENAKLQGIKEFIYLFDPSCYHKTKSNLSNGKITDFDPNAYGEGKGRALMNIDLDVGLAQKNGKTYDIEGDFLTFYDGVVGLGGMEGRIPILKYEEFVIPENGLPDGHFILKQIENPEKMYAVKMPLKIADKKEFDRSMFVHIVPGASNLIDIASNDNFSQCYYIFSTHENIAQNTVLYSAYLSMFGSVGIEQANREANLSTKFGLHSLFSPTLLNGKYPKGYEQFKEIGRQRHEKMNATMEETYQMIDTMKRMTRITQVVPGCFQFEII